MLRDIDLNKMNTLIEENEDAKEIIHQLLLNHHTVVSTISHEIRNPLTLISSSLQIMELKNPEVHSYTGWVQLIDDVNYLRLLLDELSALNNGHTLNRSSFSIETLLKNVALSFAASLENEEKEILFTSHIPSTLGSYMGDQIKLKEVLLNLLRNAKEAINENGEIFLRAFWKNSSLIIEVQDNGCGIEPEKLSTIFDPFITYKSNGTGLGLALSKRIIESHGGSLTVLSSPESGSTFTIHLPL